MPMPRWVAQVNKRVFNKVELKRGARPVMLHVGRSSGREHRTPLDAHQVDGGYLFFPIYGSSSDWVRNVIAAGHAQLEVDGERVELMSPRLIDQDEARQQLPDSVKLPPSFLRVAEFLRMDLAT